MEFVAGNSNKLQKIGFEGKLSSQCVQACKNNTVYTSRLLNEQIYYKNNGIQTYHYALCEDRYHATCLKSKMKLISYFFGFLPFHYLTMSRNWCILRLILVLCVHLKPKGHSQNAGLDLELLCPPTPLILGQPTLGSWHHQTHMN